MNTFFTIPLLSADPIMLMHLIPFPSLTALMYRQANAWLEKHPDVDAIFTVPDSAAAVSQAIRERGLIGKIIHIGYGMTDSTRPCILEGSLSAAIGHRAEHQGYMPFSILLDYFATGKLPDFRRVLMLNDIFIKQNSVF